MQNQVKGGYAFLILLALLLSTGNGDSQFKQSDRQPDAHVFGRSRFNYNVYNMSSADRQKSQLLIYWAFIYDILQFEKGEQGKFRAKYELTFSLLNPKMDLIDSHAMTKELVVDSFEATNSTESYEEGHTIFSAAPGKYVLRIELMDLDTQRSLVREQELVLRDFQREKMCLSDIIFANKIRYDSTGKITIHPNLSANFEDPGSDFFSYIELYPPSAADLIEISYSIIGSHDEVAFDTVATLVASKLLHRYVFNLRKQISAPGRYFIEIEARCEKQKAKMRRRFFVQWGNLPVSFKNIDEAIEPLQMIGKAEEFTDIEKATPEEKETVFRQFWERRDPTPDTEENEFQTEFYRRVDFCNQNFSVFTNDKRGWATDRGKVFLQYGEPTTVEKQTGDLNQPALEIWYYDSQRRRYIFADRSGIGDYQLIRVE
ncbi:GWxTD domain-containing protein [candidate division KSB1 bacterium]|nr:GWxTD domain-containing protein [candidate division KSB1 bacterium]